VIIGPRTRIIAGSAEERRLRRRITWLPSLLLAAFFTVGNVFLLADFVAIPHTLVEWVFGFGFLILWQIFLVVGAIVRRRYETQINRLAKNLCPTCGYDLRATPDRCPECGRASKPQQQEAL
jgi:hypothetical protein